MNGVDWHFLNDLERDLLSASYADAIALACNATEDKITNRNGNRSHVSLVEAREIQGYVSVPASSSASEVASAIRSNHLQVSLVNTTESVLGDHNAIKGQIRMTQASVEPNAFSTTTSTRAPSTTSVFVTTTVGTSSQATSHEASTSFLSGSKPSLTLTTESLLSGADRTQRILGYIGVHILLPFLIML